VGRLTGIDTVLLDLDGTLYVGSQVVPGAPEAVRWLRAQGLTVRFTTNTDSIPPAALADRLARLGFPASEEELVTPVAVAAQLFASTDEARVLAVAADGVRQLLAGCLAGPDDRVVCCYPVYGRLLAAAADHARRALVFSYPPRNLLSRAFYGVFNLVMRLTGSSFRGFAHPPGAMLAVLEDHGLRQTFKRRSQIWQVAGLVRVS
jgi:Haloacid dehalogenase-like hydrolase